MLRIIGGILALLGFIEMVSLSLIFVGIALP